ncbi:transposase [Streptomyces sp. NPDC006733]|uniref:RNA-guided endonuclease InsQ/TnpB family protein n=1 Tax=Streptomyces sp. NPDC006733 TaxID=3155460 RepID=UPI0033ED4D6A
MVRSKAGVRRVGRPELERLGIPAPSRSGSAGTRIGRERIKAVGTTERSYRFRCYPTEAQSHQLHRTFGACRWVYNQALELRSSAWRQHHVRIGYTETCRALTGWRNTEETAWLREISSVVLQQSLRHLERAHSRFFRGVSRHPQHKRKHRARDSATYVQAGVGFRWAADAGRPGTGPPGERPPGVIRHSMDPPAV